MIKQEITTKKKAAIALMLIILSATVILNSMMASAAPPVTTVQQLADGIQISYPNPYYIESGQNLSVRFWVFNLSTGDTLTNTSMNCTYNLLDHNGKNILRLSTPDSAGIHFANLPATACQNCFNFEVRSGNFTRYGLYLFQIRCDGGFIGGYNSGNYELNKNGQPPADGFIIAGILMVLIIIAIFFFGLGSVIEFRPAKMFFYFMSGVMIIFLVAAAMNITSDYFLASNIEGIFSSIWYLCITLLTGGVVVGIIFAIILAYESLMDKKGKREDD